MLIFLFCFFKSIILIKFCKYKILINYNEEDSHSDDKPKHSKWKLYKVIAGHTGWVRCIDVDQFNKFFVTGSNDRVIKFWDLASGKLKALEELLISLGFESAMKQNSLINSSNQNKSLLKFL